MNLNELTFEAPGCDQPLTVGGVVALLRQFPDRDYGNAELALLRLVDELDDSYWDLIEAARSDEDAGDSLYWWARDRIRVWVDSGAVSLRDFAWHLHDTYLTDESLRQGYTNEDVEMWLDWWDDLAPEDPDHKSGKNLR